MSSVNAAEDNWGWKVYSIQPDGTLQLNSGIIDQTSGRLTFTQVAKRLLLPTVIL